MKHMMLLVCLMLMPVFLRAQTSDPSKPGDVLLNEVMANPKGLTALPETEYIEFYNASGKSLSLKGWVFIYDKTAIALPDVTLPIGGYAVLYREGREIVIPTEALRLGLKKFPANLANGGKHIALKNSEGHLIHAYDYPKAVAGKSHERGADNTWHLSTDPRGGTPGMVNSSPTSPPEPTPPPEPPTPPQPPVQPDPSKPGDVLLNEVMANPKGLTALPETEYIEIYNASGKSLSLKGWVFIYDKTTIALPDVTLPIGGYAVLYREGREIVIPTEALKLGLKKFPANLANAGKHIALKNSEGHLIHAYDYPKAVAGKSHERGSDNKWHLCTDPRGGTPGAVNSSPTSPPEPTPPPEPPTPPEPIPEEPIKIEPGEIIVNEILPNPFAGGSEFIELYNRSGRTLPVNGLALAIRKANGEIGTQYPLTSVKDSLAADGYLVVTSNRSGVADFYTIPFPERIHELKLPVLHNNEATIVLLRKTDSLVIDKVAYSSKWHDAAIRHIKGVSLERIRPDGASEEASNWTSAASETGYATPGYRNSQFRDTQADYSLAIEPPEYLHTADRYAISYRTDKTGYRCRAEVYTPNGKRVAEIVNNQLLTPNGKISWDGTGTDGSRLSPGVYIFFAELYHSDGNRRRVKKAFLVH